MAKQKYYTVWKWRNPGIFENWEECKKSVEWYVWALYKSFSSYEEAKIALKWSVNDYIGNTKKPTKVSNSDILKYGNPIMKSISVDGAWNTISGWCEYQWVDTDSGELLFHGWPYADGTNNIAEFLAIVHALSYCKKLSLDLPIYSDSKTAISWVKAKNARTKQPRTQENIELFTLIDKAVLWLQKNEFKNPIIKWETSIWGEIKADFGRK